MLPSELNDLQKHLDECEAISRAKLREKRKMAPGVMRVFVENAARLIAKKGLDCEKRLMKSNPRVDFSFLKSSEDPFHAYYQQKLTEYLSHQEEEVEEKEEDGASVIEPPPEKKTLIVRIARLVARHGFEFENKDHTEDPNLSFLVSSDPFHGFYQHKLNQFLSQRFPVDDGLVASAEIIEPPPGHLRNVIKNTVRHLSKRGLQSERLMMSHAASNPTYTFMKKSHPFHAFFRYKLSESRSHPDQQEEEEDGANNQDTATVSQAHCYTVQSRAILPPDPDLPQLTSHGGRAYLTMRVTAQFAAWYGKPFWLPLKGRPGFEFTDPNDSRFPCFSQFVIDYSNALQPPKDLEGKLLESDAYTAAIHDGFFRLLQWDLLHELKEV